MFDRRECLRYRYDRRSRNGSLQLEGFYKAADTDTAWSEGDGESMGRGTGTISGTVVSIPNSVIIMSATTMTLRLLDSSLRPFKQQSISEHVRLQAWRFPRCSSCTDILSTICIYTKIRVQDRHTVHVSSIPCHRFLPFANMPM